MDTPIDPAAKHLAIIQVTRIGDILQTCHAARLLKINHPDIKISLIARKQFIEPIRFLVTQIFDHIHSLDLKSSINLNDGMSGSVYNIKKQLKAVNHIEYSASINLSFSKSSSYLHSLIKSKHKIGPHYNLKNEKIIQDKWSQYLFASVMRGALNPFNLVDLFSNIIGVEKKSTHLSNKEFSQAKKDNILIHPFASHDKKYWKSSKWTEVIYRILSENKDVTIHIAGSSEDQEKYDEIVNVPILEKVKERIRPIIGQSLSDLYKQVDETYLFIGHDSMLGNLLSFKNIKTITVSLGTVRPLETAPYAINNIVLAPKTSCYPCFPNTKCEFYKCHGDIPYQALQGVVNQLLKSNNFNKKEFVTEVSPFHLNSVSINKTTVNNVGQLIFENLLDDFQTAKDVFIEFYRTIWSYTFSEVDIEVAPLNINQQTKAVLSSQAQTIAHIYELTEFGKKYSRYILEEISNKTPDITKIKSFSKKIDEIDRLLDVLTETSPYIAPIIDYGTVAKSNLHGDNLVQLTESSFYIYQEMANCASIIYEFLTKLDLVKHNEQTQASHSTRKNV